MVYNEITVNFSDSGLSTNDFSKLNTSSFKDEAEKLGFTVTKAGIIGSYDSYDAIDTETNNKLLKALKKAYNNGLYC